MGTKVPNLKTHSVLRGDTPSRCQEQYAGRFSGQSNADDELAERTTDERITCELPANRTVSERPERPA